MDKTGEVFFKVIFLGVLHLSMEQDSIKQGILGRCECIGAVCRRDNHRAIGSINFTLHLTFYFWGTGPLRQVQTSAEPSHSCILKSFSVCVHAGPSS